MADFDPGAYLKAKTVPSGTSATFDPDSYLASKTGAKPTPQFPSFSNRPELVQAPQQEPEGPGLFARSVNAIVEGAKAAGKAGGELVHDAGQRMAGAFGLPHQEPSPEVESARVHQMLRGFGNAMTAGHERDIEQVAQPNSRFRTLVHLAGQRAAGAFGLPHEAPPTPEERAKLLAYPGPSEGEQQDEWLAPNFRPGSEFVSSFLPNPITEAAGVVGGPVVKALEKVPAKGIVQNMIMGAAKGAARYIPAATANAAAMPDSNLRTVVDAATNPLGLGIGMGFGAIGGGAKGFAENVRDPLTQTGKDLAAIKAVNGEVRPFGEPARGGEFESPEMQGLDKGRAGRHQLAAKSVDRVLAANDEQYHAAQQSWGETADNILKDHGDETHFASKTHDVLDKLEQDNQVNGVVGDEKLANAIQKARAMLKAPEGAAPHAPAEPPSDVKQLLVLREGAKSPMVRDAIDAQIKAAGGDIPEGVGGTKVEHPGGGRKPPAPEVQQFAYDDITGKMEPVENPYGPHHLDKWDVAGQPQTERNTPPLKMQFEPTQVGPAPDLSPVSPENTTGVKVEDFIKARKVLNRMARNTQDPSERYAFGKILDAMKADAQDIDPRIAKLNADYAKQMQSLTATNDALFGQAKPVVKVTEGVKQSATARMDRIGEDTKPGMRAEPRIERFSQARPSNAREAALNRAKQAAERLRYGEPQTSTGFEQSIARGAHRATASTVGAATGGALGHVPGAIAGYAAGKLLENLPQVKVRIGLPVADVVSRNVNGYSSIPANRIMELSRASREEDKKRSRAILNGAK